MTWSRYDLVPAAAATLAVVAAGTQRPRVSGAYAGIGAALKLWPAVLAPVQRTRRAAVLAVATALAKDPADRPTSAGELALAMRGTSRTQGLGTLIGWHAAARQQTGGHDQEANLVDAHSPSKQDLVDLRPKRLTPDHARKP